MTNTQLLISVTNTTEALMAMNAGANIIDLKDPNVGALGALPYETTRDIVLAINNRALVSATVGEHHHTIADLNKAVKHTADLGVDIVKIALNENLARSLLADIDFLKLINQLKNNQVNLIAVLFADQSLAMNILPLIKELGFYGVMLDTAHKNGKSLIYYITGENLKIFMQMCGGYQLVTGLAGSLNINLAESLLNSKPNYLGFRGGVCHDLNRQSKLDKDKILKIKNLLLNYNKFSEIPH